MAKIMDLLDIPAHSMKKFFFVWIFSFLFIHEVPQLSLKLIIDTTKSVKIAKIREIYGKLPEKGKIMDFLDIPAHSMNKILLSSDISYFC